VLARANAITFVVGFFTSNPVPSASTYLVLVLNRLECKHSFTTSHFRNRGTSSDSDSRRGLVPHLPAKSSVALGMAFSLPLSLSLSFLFFFLVFFFLFGFFFLFLFLFFLWI